MASHTKPHTCIILAGVTPAPEDFKVSGVYLYKATGKFAVKVSGKQMFQAWFNALDGYEKNI